MIYLVTTLESEGDFFIIADPIDHLPSQERFTMHYHSMADFVDDWEDID